MTQLHILLSMHLLFVLNFKRTFQSRIRILDRFSGYQMFAGYVGLFAFGFVTATYASKLFKIRRVEQRSSVNALYPLMMAERDRE